MKKTVSLIILISASLALLTACGKKNITHISTSTTCPEEYIFDDTFNQAWEATKDAISAQNTIKFMDRESGIITTEPKTVDGKELSLLDIFFLGKTYKYTYTVNLSGVSGTKTLIRIDVKLFEKIAALLEREDNIAHVNSYLRSKLFRNICGRLSSTGSALCDEQFAEYYSGSSGRQNSSANTAGSQAPRKSKKRPDQQTKSVQRSLLDNGYDPGPVDGFMGNKTRSAIRKYQQANGMGVTGEISNELLVSLDLVTSQKTQNVPQQEQVTDIPSRSSQESRAPVAVSQNSPEENSVTAASEQKTVHQEKTPPQVEDNQENQEAKSMADDLPAPAVEIKEETEEVPKKVIRGTVTEQVELKSEPDPFSESIASVPKNSEIEVMDKTSFWLKIKYMEHVGYVMGDMVQTD